MSNSWRVAAVASFALLGLLWAWAWPREAGDHFNWVLPALLCLPMLAPAFAFALRRPRAALWAGIAALFYFCHGVAELRVSAPAFPVLEIALSLLVIFAAGWPGIAAKMAKRRAAPPPNV